eukprot:GHVO01006667.1.p1 GENE.GHVO01006667.1~~GHVO01006667.1.p1  ORF type:complete len:284 (+),score=53.31 GHVO01006667.1:98-853(+)
MLMLMTWGHINAAFAVWSLAVSIKMNALLFGPGMAFILYRYYKCEGLYRALIPPMISGIIQLILGAPFLLTHPIPYMHKAFELSREFTHQWSVNYAFVDPSAFASPYMSLSLLALHIILLGGVCLRKWRTLGQDEEKQDDPPSKGTLKKPQKDVAPVTTTTRKLLGTDDIVFILLSSNFIGVACARTLHYQFYAWHYPYLPWLLHYCRVHQPLKILFLGAIEYIFNVFPPAAEMSLLLHGLHAYVLILLLK